MSEIYSNTFISNMVYYLYNDKMYAYSLKTELVYEVNLERKLIVYTQALEVPDEVMNVFIKVSRDFWKPISDRKSDLNEK